VFTWRALEYFGWDYAKYIGRAPVRYITRPTNPAMMIDVDNLIKKYELLERDLRVKTGDDETDAITGLADRIGRSNDFTEIPEMLAQALGDGLSLEGTGEGLSVGGSTLFLRSLTGNPMDVHINTGANTRRYLLRQPELSRRIKLQAIGWPTCRPGRRTSSWPSSAPSSTVCRWVSGCRPPASPAGARPTR
jgi:hypothetical protein